MLYALILSRVSSISDNNYAKRSLDGCRIALGDLRVNFDVYHFSIYLNQYLSSRSDQRPTHDDPFQVGSKFKQFMIWVKSLLGIDPI